MICEKCNNQIDDDSKFCPFCGHKIEKNREEVEIYKSEENISNNIKKDLLSKDEELEINTNSKLKSIIFRIIAIILAYFGFMAVEIWLVGKGISFGEAILTSMFVFLAIYKSLLLLYFFLFYVHKKGKISSHHLFDYYIFHKSL
jgi:hypothetical protein